MILFTFSSERLPPAALIRIFFVLVESSFTSSFPTMLVAPVTRTVLTLLFTDFVVAAATIVLLLSQEFCKLFNKIVRPLFWNPVTRERNDAATHKTYITQAAILSFSLGSL